MECFDGLQALRDVFELSHQSRDIRRTRRIWLWDIWWTCLLLCLLLNRWLRWWLLLLVDHVEQLRLPVPDVLEVLGYVVTLMLRLSSVIELDCTRKLR